MNAVKRQSIGDSLGNIVEKARHGGRPLSIGLMLGPNEHGREELLRGGHLAQNGNPQLRIIPIGPRYSGFEDMDWVETDDREADIRLAMEKALGNGRIAGAVAAHFPFPIGVVTIGRILTPARGLPMFIASSTGSAAACRAEALLRNALYGIAAAKACGIASPTAALLNVEGAAPVLRALERMRDNGYGINLGRSGREDGGPLLRGNDIVSGGLDVLVCDTLTGNTLVKIFSAYASGGFYESLGWGYGPSAGEGWRKVISIVSRGSGAPVIANALVLTAMSVNGGLPEKVSGELEEARRAGLDVEIQGLTSEAARKAAVARPQAVPVEAEIAGVDVLDMETAAQLLWKEGIYAETAMGCTGPVVRVQQAVKDKAAAILRWARLI
jgi:betaine reductase